MAYARRSRRTGRRGNRTLSTRRIFNNKGAKAQAAQIHALKKRINRVYRKCKPEVKKCESNNYHDIVGHPGIYQIVPPAGSPGATQVVEQFKRYEFTLPQRGTADSERIGNLIRIYSPTISFSSQYKQNINTISTPMLSPLFNTSGGVRMVVVQAKNAHATQPTFDEILKYRPNTLDESIAVLNSPFVDGITAKFNILYNKVFYYSVNKLIRCKNVKVKPVIRSLQYETGQTYPKGMIYVFLFAGGFSYRSPESQDYEDFDVCDYSLKFSLPYSDA